MGERYEIKEKIGQGGLGAVYRAIDNQLKREVALKRLLPPGEGEAADVDPENLLNEATTLSSLQHPNIVTVYDVGKDGKGAFVVMELLKGETFDQTVERGALTEKDFRNVVAQTMEALVAAHHSDIVHRDLKPSNLMVNWLPSGKFQIKILDFGLAKFGKKPHIQTVDHGDAILGSIYFMAPEQFERVPLDPRTDLYSIGALYHYCLTGDYPFNGETAPQVMAAHLQNKVKPLRELRPDLPPWMADWVMWLISREMSDRPESAKHALDFFHEEKSGRPTSAVAAGGGAPVLPVAPSHAAAPPPPPPGTLTAPLGAPGNPGGVPAAQPTGPLSAPVAMPDYSAALPRNRFPVPIWAMITIPVLLIALLVVYLTKSGAKRLIEERNQMVLALNEAETPRGDADTVAAFIEFIKAQGNDARGKNNVSGAMTTLQRLSGSEVDAALLEQVGKVPSKLRPGLLAAVVNRGYAAALPTLLKYIDSDDPDLSRIAIGGLAILGGSENVGTLLDELKNPASEASERALSDSIVQIAYKSGDLDARSAPVLAALGDADTDYRNRLLQILGRLGGDKAWAELEKVLRGSDKEARTAALIGLNNWPDGKPAETVFQIASNDSDAVMRGTALRTYVSLLNNPSDTPEEKLAQRIGQLLKEERVARKTRRELMFSLASMADPAALEVAESWEADPTLGPVAEQVIEEIKLRAKKLQKADGTDLVLKAEDAKISGEDGFKFDRTAVAIVGWTYAGYYVTWAIEFGAAGKYAVVVKAATPSGGGGEYAVTLAGGRLVSATPKSRDFIEQELGEIEIVNPGIYRLTVTGIKINDEGESLMQLRSVELKAK